MFYAAIVTTSITAVLVAAYVAMINIEEQKKIAKQPLLGVVYRR